MSHCMVMKMNDRALFLEGTEIIVKTKLEELRILCPRDDEVDDETVINGLDVKWSYKDNEDKPPDFSIEIDGLTDTTMNKIALKDNVIVNAGYNKNLGQVCSGMVIKKTCDKGSLKLECSEIKVTYNKTVSATYTENTPASTILQDLAKKISFYVKQMDLKDDVIYRTGEAIFGHGLKEIENIVKDCGSKMSVRENMIYIYDEELITKNKIVLDYTSGLLEEPESQNIQEIKIESKKSKETNKKPKK